MRIFIIAFLLNLVSVIANAQLQTYLSNSQHLLKQKEGGIGVNAIEETFLIKTDFNPKMKVGSKVVLRLVSENTAKAYDLVLKSITAPKGTKGYNFAIAKKLSSYPDIKVSFEVGNSSSEYHLIISVVERSLEWLIPCKKVE